MSLVARLGRRCGIRATTLSCRRPDPLSHLDIRFQSTEGESASASRGEPTPATRRRKAKAKPKDKPAKILDWGELPTALLTPEGEAVAPLSVFTEVKSRRRRGSASAEGNGIGIGIGNENEDADAAKSAAKARADAAEEAAYVEAVRNGTIPETPLAKLVWLNWRRFPDCVLLTQVGNFYESYFEPAIKVSSLLGIKLTSKTYKSGTFPFTGFPIHQRDKYLKLLVHDLGYTVALIEEEKDPLNLKEAGADINRRIARIVTPGTLLDETWMTGNESRYLLAIALSDDKEKEKRKDKPKKRGKVDSAETQEHAPIPLCLAYADVSTGEFFTKEGTSAEIEDELARIAPREIVLDARLRDAWAASDAARIAASSTGQLFALLRVLGVHVSFASLPAAADEPKTKTAKRTGAAAAPLERDAIALLRQHLEYALRDAMPEIPQFNREVAQQQMHIDAATLQALEIRSAFRPGGMVPTASPLSLKGTLLSTLSRTVTDPGHRLLKRTLSAPSTDLAAIDARLALVAAFAEREHLRTDLRDALRGVADVMRVVQRFKAHAGEGSDVWAVARWVRDVERVLGIIRVAVELETGGRKPKQTLLGQAEGAQRLMQLVGAFAPLAHLAEGIENAIDEVGLGAVEGSEEGDVDAKPDRERDERQRWWIKPSFSTELTDLHARLVDLAARRAALQARLQAELDAPTLALGTNLRGAFIVTVKRKTELGTLERNGNFHAVSETRSSKAFAYSEWSALGTKIEKALAELSVAQARALRRLRAMVIEHADGIRANAELVDEIDLSAGFAQAAVELNLARPTLHEGTELDIVNGRHPSVEAGLQASLRTFTPNSTHMGPKLHVITGPNQGGKSTLLRQTAIIAILAQSGSFVPADSARIGIVDRVFSRVGARDDLFRDRSTFMLEMVETAAILKYATPRSLVIMDEIGRGTTLHAGVAIAYATLDYVLKEIGCRTLFATHYHELARMLGAPAPSGGRGSAVTHIPPDHPGLRPGVAFFCTDVDEMGAAFAYSYRLRSGVNYDSHAIKAAQLAGMPASFLATAEKTLGQLESVEKVE